MARLADLDVVGRLEHEDLDALLHGGVDLGAQGRHVVDAAAVGHLHARGSGAHARAGAVHGHVAAADHDDALAGEVGIGRRRRCG